MSESRTVTAHEIFNNSIKAIRKINTYAQNGIYVGDRLLLTYETSQDPVDMRLLQKMLKKLFL